MKTIEEIQRIVALAAPNYDIKRAELFGSYADGQATVDSDVDLLIEFNTPSVSLLKISGLTLYLQESLGIEVDVVHAPVAEGSLLAINNKVAIYG